MSGNKLPDAIILATAIVNDMQLITHNVSDFYAFSNRISIMDPLGEIDYESLIV
jgi:hypothetical protein